MAEVAAGFAVGIDHAGARIYDLPFGNDHRKPHETHHVLHSINRKQHDADREENYPGDHRFFDAIAKDLLGAARIVILSHGTGQSNEGDHLLDYMSKHHRTIHDRVTHVVVADLSHTSVPQLLVLASKACSPSCISPSRTRPEQPELVQKSSCALRAMVAEFVGRLARETTRCPRPKFNSPNTVNVLLLITHCP